MIDRIGYLTAQEVAEFVAAPVADELSDTFQATSPVLDGVAAVPSDLGLVEQTAAGVFGVRAIGVAAPSSIPTRADADARYAASGSGVASVNTRTGAVTLVKADVGLGSVDNTADAGKAVLSATKLATARTINGVAFDGSAAITISATDSTARLAVASNLSDLASAATARTNLGLGSLATQSGTFSGTHSGASSGTNTGDQTTITGNAGTATKLATARAINGVAFDGTAAITINAVDSTAREPAITSGTTAQYWRGDKTWQTLNAAAVAGLGTMATQAASAVAITGGSIAGITDLAVADGGTGASSASAARSNLGAAASGANTDIINLMALTGLTVSPGVLAFKVGVDSDFPTGALAVSLNGVMTDAGLLGLFADTGGGLYPQATGGIYLRTGGNNIRLSVKANGIVNLANCPNYASDAAAGAAGLVAGDLYRTGGAMMVKA